MANTDPQHAGAPGPYHNSAKDSAHPPQDAEDSLRQKVCQIGERLRTSFSSLTAAMPGAPRRPVELSKTLHVNQALAGKLLHAVRKHDPLLSTHLMPGPEALRTVIAAAAGNDVDAELIQAAQEAVVAFDELLRREVGGRAELDAIIGAWLPEARRRFEMGSKQAAYRAMCNIKGVAAELLLQTLIAHPSARSPDYLDGAEVIGTIGLRRVRPGVPARFSTECVGLRDDSGPRWECLDGTPIDEAYSKVLLRDFCSPPDPDVEIRLCQAGAQYLLGRQSLGIGATIDVFLAHVGRDAVPPQPASGPPRKRGTGGSIDLPARKLQMDVLLHKDVWPNRFPDLEIYDTAVHGLCDANDPASEIDLLQLHETIDYLGEGLERFRSADVPRYLELLQHVFDQLGWDVNEFRGYRVCVMYPVYGSQFELVFDPP